MMLAVKKAGIKHVTLALEAAAELKRLYVK